MSQSKSGLTAETFVTPSLSNIAAEIAAFFSYNGDSGYEDDGIPYEEQNVISPKLNSKETTPRSVAHPENFQADSVYESIMICIEGKIVFLDSAITFDGHWYYRNYNQNERANFNFVKPRNLANLTQISRNLSQFFNSNGNILNTETNESEKIKEILGKWKGEFYISGRKTTVQEKFEIRESSMYSLEKNNESIASESEVSIVTTPVTPRTGNEIPNSVLKTGIYKLEGEGSNAYGEFTLEGEYLIKTSDLILKKRYFKSFNTEVLESPKEIKEEAEYNRISTRKRKIVTHFSYAVPEEIPQTLVQNTHSVSKKGRGRP